MMLIGYPMNFSDSDQTNKIREMSTIIDVEISSSFQSNGSFEHLKGLSDRKHV